MLSLLSSSPPPPWRSIVLSSINQSSWDFTLWQSHLATVNTTQMHGSLLGLLFSLHCLNRLSKAATSPVIYSRREIKEKALIKRRVIIIIIIISVRLLQPPSFNSPCLRKIDPLRPRDIRNYQRLRDGLVDDTRRALIYLNAAGDLGVVQ